VKQEPSKRSPRASSRRLSVLDARALGDPGMLGSARVKLNELGLKPNEPLQDVWLPLKVRARAVAGSSQRACARAPRVRNAKEALVASCAPGRRRRRPQLSAIHMRCVRVQAASLQDGVCGDPVWRDPSTPIERLPNRDPILLLFCTVSAQGSRTGSIHLQFELLEREPVAKKTLARSSFAGFQSQQAAGAAGAALVLGTAGSGQVALPSGSLPPPCALARPAQRAAAEQLGGSLAHAASSGLPFCTK
jgi:hypothetical protein